MAQTANPYTFDDALAALDWPEGQLHDAIEQRRIFWSGYDRERGRVTSDTFPEARTEVDRVNGKLTLWWIERRDHPTIEGLKVWEQYATVEGLKVWLPVGQRPPQAPIDQKATWRDPVSVADLKAAMKDIAKSYEGKPPPSEADVWLALKAHFGREDLPRDVARSGIADYAPQLKRRRGQTKKIKSRK